MDDGHAILSLSPEQVARRRQISFCKHPVDDAKGHAGLVPSVDCSGTAPSAGFASMFSAGAGPSTYVPDIYSSDDDVSTEWSSVLDELTDDDATLTDKLRLNRASGLPALPSTSCSPFPSAHSSGSAYLHELHAGSLDAMPLDVLSADGLDEPLPALPDNLARVAATHFVPPCKVATNQRMRMPMRRHREFMRAGLRPGNVGLPLPMDFITILKRSWPGRILLWRSSSCMRALWG